MGFHSRAIPLKLIAQNRSALNFIHELHPEQILYKKIFLIRSADIFQKDLLDLFDISRFASTYVRCSQKLTFFIFGPIALKRIEHGFVSFCEHRT